MLHIYTGEGKGKTTASIGQLVRFIGYNNRGIFSQFLKTTESGEILFLEKYCKDSILVIRNNKPFPFSNKMSDKQKEDIREIHNKIFYEATSNFKKNYGILVLDEIISTYNLNLIDKEIVEDFLLNLNDDKEVIITGRDCPKCFLDKANYISNIKNEKNPFDFGISARKGIEY